MSYLVTLHRRADRALERLPEREARRIVLILKEMESEPLSGDIRRLSGSSRPLWRRRVGEYRIVFSVSIEREVVIVERIERRTGGMYERF